MRNITSKVIIPKSVIKKRKKMGGLTSSSEFAMLAFALAKTVYTCRGGIIVL